MKLLHIGKIFTIRWVASSEKTLKAVWNNYVPLFDHFSKAANDIKRDSKERSKYVGLKRILTSVEFVTNLGKFSKFSIYMKLFNQLSFYFRNHV